MVFVVQVSDVAPDHQFILLKNSSDFLTICFVWRRPSHVVQLQLNIPTTFLELQYH